MTKIKVFQGMARYNNVPKADQEEYILKTIEKYKMERIKDFTLSIPQRENMILVCKNIVDFGDLKKVAEICEANGKTVLKLGVKTSELEVEDKEILGHLEMNLFGMTTYYEVTVKSVPDYSDFEDGAVAFVDGSGGGTDVIEYEGKTYYPYGGAYLIYKNNDKDAFLSSAEEEEFIDAGLKGVSTNVGNVYGEINSIIRAIIRADKEGIKKLRVYYDCEQIGGNAPGGVNNKANTKITKKYMDFWKNLDLKNLEYIELVHVDAHTKFDLNNVIDELAKKMRDAVLKEFYEDINKRVAYLDPKNDYV